MVGEHRVRMMCLYDYVRVCDRLDACRVLHDDVFAVVETETWLEKKRPVTVQVAPSPGCTWKVEYWASFLHKTHLSRSGIRWVLTEVCETCLTFVQSGGPDGAGTIQPVETTG